jgi:hypothetical protein
MAMPSSTDNGNSGGSGSANNIFSKCLAGGAGCGIAGLVTNPFDVIKVRNQQHSSHSGTNNHPHGQKYISFHGTARSIYLEEGLHGFTKGASASVLRECTYSAMRMGLYEPIKLKYSTLLCYDDIYENGSSSSSSSSSPIVKWLSAFTSGACASAIFNPIDVVKVRFQSAHTNNNNKPPYSSLPNAFYTIYNEKGMRGLYIGTSATVTRAAFVTSAELGTYDIIKNNILVSFFDCDKEANGTQFTASFLASLITTTVANPADVVKTRIMNDPHGLVGRTAMDHFYHVLQSDGPSGFMKGWMASYLRIGPHTVISIVLIEKVRQMMGMTSY